MGAGNQLAVWLCAATALLLVSSGCSSRISPLRLGKVFKPVHKKVEAPSASAMHNASPAQVSAVQRAMRLQAEGAFDPLEDDATLRRLREDVRQQPQDPRLRLQLARRYESYALADQAFEEYRALLDGTNSLPPAPGKDSVGSLYSAALLGVAVNGLAASRAREALAVLETQPQPSQNPDLQLRMGLLYDQAGEPAKAVEAYRRAVGLDPGSTVARNNLGYRLMQQGDLLEAELQLRAAIANPAGSITARNNLGELLTRRGDLSGAWEQFQAAGPDEAAARNNFAVVLLRAGKLSESREQLLLALRARRGYAPALRNFQIVQQRIRSASAVAPGAAGKGPGRESSAGEAAAAVSAGR